MLTIMIYALEMEIDLLGYEEGVVVLGPQQVHPDLFLWTLVAAVLRPSCTR